MKVILAALADSARAQDDGKVNILGGGLDAVHADAFPFVQPSIALVLKLEFAATECEARHQIEIRAVREDDREFLPLFVLAIVPRRDPRRPDLPVTFPLVRTVRDLRFDKPGRYRFQVMVNKQEVASIELRAVLTERPASQSATFRDVLQVSLDAGYEAFVAGDLDRAWSIVSTVVDEFPQSADAQNNYGFILLARGEALDAIEAFRRAEEAGYALPELLQANMASCLYLVKQYKMAFDKFRTLINARFLSDSAVLFALGATSQAPVQLWSPADYLALMALNAARSALQSGLVNEALEFSAIATTGHLSFSQDEDSRPVFEKFLAELKVDVDAAAAKATPQGSESPASREKDHSDG
jgi:tetratricopeptide (TPR) repeat protein